MATFFGEVQFPQSRAFVEDDADIIERYEIEYVPRTEREIKCTSLVVFFGALANEFFDGCITPSGLKLFGEIKLKRISTIDVTDTGDFHPLKLDPCLLYVNSDKTLFCQTSRHMVAQLATKVSRKLLSFIEDSSPVLILSSHHSSKIHFDSEFTRSECSTYSLCSESKLTTNIPFPSLPQPAFLDSLPGAIMTGCVIHTRYCLTFASYTDSTASRDVDTIVPDFVKAINYSSFKKDIIYNKATAVKNKCDVLDCYM